MTRFLQIGTSRFLQAHVDLFVDEALGANQICVVQSSGSASTAGRLEALAAPEGYPVRIRGLSEGQEVDREVRVRSVSHALSTATEWGSVLNEALTCEFLISNVSEKGYIANGSDGGAVFQNAVSYPVKLYFLLEHRFQNGGEPLPIMPLELFESNGDNLKRLVLDLANRKQAGRDFTDWLGNCVWVNSLVDRIVSAPIEPAGAVAEPYALWAIQDTPGLEFPFEHPNVKIVPDLQPYQVLKLFILNLTHTYMANRWLMEKMPSDMTVREYLAGNSRRNDAQSMVEEEVIPGFAAGGLESEAKDYLAATMERFCNPFLDHYFSDIIDGHPQKIASRAGGFLKWAGSNNDRSPKPRLKNLLSSGG